MKAQTFGHQHTIEKLNAVEKYLDRYTTALKNQSFELLYIDACAGSGASVPKQSSGNLDHLGDGLFDNEKIALVDTQQMVLGSPIRALNLKNPFHKYLFNDYKRSNINSLKNHVEENFPSLKNRVEYSRSDANEMLLNVCRDYNWRQTRAVVFLDPFGLQINYDTLVALARTGAVDVWYLVPVFAMYRQVTGTGDIHEDGGRRVDIALGTQQWREVVAHEYTPTDLFGTVPTVKQRVVNIDWFEKIAKEQIGYAFSGQVLDETLRLGKNGTHEFSLMFAWANQSERAKLASKLAKAVLKNG